jgi:hypothetical protein
MFSIFENMAKVMVDLLVNSGLRAGITNTTDDKPGAIIEF